MELRTQPPVFKAPEPETVPGAGRGTDDGALVSDFIAAALGLDRPWEIAAVYPGALYLGRDNVDGFSLHRIRLPFNGRRQAPPDGACALLTEAGFTDDGTRDHADFGLLYGAAGALAGIFPLPGTGWAAGSIFCYFDLTDFSPRLAELREPDVNEAQAPLMARWLDCRAAVTHFKAVWQAARPGLLLEKKCVRNALGSEAPAYAGVGFDSDGRWQAESWPSSAARQRALERRLLVPVFPTVFSPGHAGNRLADAPYYEALYGRLPLEPGSKTLVLGTGSGVDAWVVSLRTGAEVCAAGINPFEVANTRAAAALGGFGARVCQSLAAAAPEGGRIFPGESFDAVVCNAPMVSAGAAPAGLADYHDRDPEGRLFLKPFARALPSLLKPGSGERALIWCRAEGAAGAEERALISGILERGTREGGREYSVRAEGSLYFLEEKAPA